MAKKITQAKAMDALATLDEWACMAIQEGSKSEEREVRKAYETVASFIESHNANV